MLTDASGYDGKDSARACVDLLNRLRAESGQPPIVAPDDRAHGKERLVAYVNHSRWVVDCPCGSAQLASRNDRRFWCTDCHNAWAQGKWASVDWPKDAEDIEALLLQRPEAKTRNWHPTEDLMALVAQNVTHGLGA